MHHFIVRQRQHKVLAEGIGKAKRHFTMVVLAVHGVTSHVLQRIVHPAHVPFVMETQPAGIGRARHGRESRGFLRQGDGLGTMLAHHFIHAFEEADRFQVLAPTVLVGNPFTGLAAVVAVQHRRHGVHTQAIHAKSLQPVQGVANQEVAHLSAAQVVDKRVPIVVETFTRVGIFVEMGAVEIAQAVRVCRKMRGYPVQQHADAGCMAAHHKTRKTFGQAEAGRGCIEADRLVTPGAVKRVFADRQ